MNPLDTAPPRATTLPLCQLQPAEYRVGYGELGMHGSLGYEGKQVTVQGRAWANSLSTHPPARVRFQLDGGWRSFRCQVALNEDVPAGRSHADFEVFADGRRVAQAYGVAAGAAPRTLAADVTGARALELVARTSRWEFSHAVWLDPVLDAAAPPAQRSLADCLGRAEILLPPNPIQARRCVATVVSPGFERHLDDFLGSLSAYGGCPDARVVVFAVGPNAECRRVAARHGAELLECRPLGRVDSAIKSILYSAARVVDAEAFVCMDADVLVLDDLSALFAGLGALPEHSILVAREGTGWHGATLEQAMTAVYRGRPGDLERIMGADGGEGAYPMVVNDGVFAGTRQAMLALDGAIRSWTGAARWVDEHRDMWWRNQAVFNLALAHLRCGVEMDPAWNVQLHVQDAEPAWEDGRMVAHWSGGRVRALHFAGPGRRKYPAWRGLFARVDAPVPRGGGGDGYGAFLRALRGWVGRHGLSALAWSFYGALDGRSARVNDADVYPLFGLLHYLVRSNGCVRVLETGTARGVSAACLASAVMHRPGAAVVSLDVADAPERATLWAALPPEARDCIQERRGESLELMDAALAAGERYDAILLDSRHDEEYVYAEWERAARLVCPGGLVLVHDPIFPDATVEAALRRIEADGYGVTRLWTAECGVREDAGLGLAVIENRRRAGA